MNKHFNFSLTTFVAKSKSSGINGDYSVSFKATAEISLDRSNTRVPQILFEREKKSEST